MGGRFILSLSSNFILICIDCLFFKINLQHQERCEQGLRTKIIKPRVEKKVAGAIDTEAEGKKAVERLDIISTFMMDFKDITEEENANFTIALHKKQQINISTLQAEALLLN